MTKLIEHKEQLKEKLLQKIIKEIDKFLKKHSKQEFYAFAFDCNKDTGEILWAFNTEKALANTIKYYKKDDENGDYDYEDKTSEDYVSLRYGIGDWKYNIEAKPIYIFGDGDKCAKMYDQIAKSDKCNRGENLQLEIMNFFEELLLAFCQTPTYRAVLKTTNFKILFSEHDDNIIDDTLPRSEKFMRRLNDLTDEKLDYKFPKILSRFSSMLSELDKRLFATVRKGDNNEVKRLVENGANVNAVEYGEFKATLTPLLIAVDENNLDCVRFLVENGANVNVKNARLSSAHYALYIAVYRGVEMTKFLLDSGADVDKSKALFAALYSKNTEIFQMLLLKYGADPNIIQSDTLLTAIIKRYSDNYALIKMLLDCGANPNLSGNIKDWSFGVPLIIAVRYGAVKIVRLLLDAGAEVNVGGTNGTPLRWLMDCEIYGEHCDDDNRIEIVKILIGAGVNINAKDKNGKTALDYVPQSSSLMRKLLEEHGAK